MTTHELFLSLLPSVTNALILNQNNESGYYNNTYTDPFGQDTRYKSGNYVIDKSGKPTERYDPCLLEYRRLRYDIDYKPFDHTIKTSWQQKLSADAIALTSQLTTDTITLLRTIPNDTVN